MMSVPSLLYLLFTITSIFALTTSSSTATIAPGSALYASNPNQTWSSPNKTFSLSFTQVRPTSYTFSIFFDGGVSIWTPYTSALDSAASFHFRSNGTLQLVNSSGEIVWDSNTSGLGITSATLDDSGEFALKKGSVSVWSSFRNLTDTIVPSQNFTVSNVLRSGLYSFRLGSTGNLTLTWNESVTYLNDSLGHFGANLTNPSLELQSNGILYLSADTFTSIAAYSNDYGEGSDDFRFIRMDNDGNLRMYTTIRGSGVTSSKWALLSDQCKVYGYCGNMGICSYVDSSPICNCPSQNFEAVDVNDGRKGCRRKVELENCAGNATLLVLNHTEFLTFQAEEIVVVGITACRSNCLGSESCVASSSLSDGSGKCYLKTPGFVSGNQSPVVPSTSYLKVCGPVQPNPDSQLQLGREEKCRRLEIWIIGAVIVFTLVCLTVLVCGFWWWYSKNGSNYIGMWGQYTQLDYASGAPVQFSYKDLLKSTKGFQERLGIGGFGAVYRGVLANGTVAAVKQLEGIQQGEKQFRMEVATISSTHHLNLVRLIGFCSEGRHRLLVYEFMKNKSLDNFLFSSEENYSEKLLKWDYRFKIALGTARGITYLHEECRDCIVHCDIKPENILLDEHYNAKVSDFGLAKLINPKDPRYKSLTDIRGTRGYLAPEWLADLPITSKSDVYSFGMVLLEMISGKRNFEVSAETNYKRFSAWAYEEFDKNNVGTLIDKKMASQGVDMEQVMKVLRVGFWCIQEHPSQRPTMGKVVQMLVGVTEIMKPPAPKTFNDVSKISITSTAGKETSHTTIELSLRAASSFSSSQAASALSSASVRNTEQASSSLIQSFRHDSC